MAELMVRKRSSTIISFEWMYVAWKVLLAPSQGES